MARDITGQDQELEEREFRAIETVLTELANAGEIAFPVTESMLAKSERKLSADSVKRLWEKIKTQDQLRQHLKVAQKNTLGEKYTFAELIKEVRSSAGISLVDVAKALRMQSVEVEALEKEKVDPLSLPAEVMADLMEVFSVPITLLEKSLKMSMARRSMQEELSSPSARSGGKVRGIEYERALKDVAAFVVERDRTADAAELPAGYLEEIERVLRRRGRESLL